MTEVPPPTIPDKRIEFQMDYSGVCFCGSSQTITRVKLGNPPMTFTISVSLSNEHTSGDQKVPGLFELYGNGASEWYGW